MEKQNQQPEQKPVKIMNLPNILSIIRMCLVPVCIAAVLYMPTICAGLKTSNAILYYWLVCSIPALIFILTSVTDLLDGKIARKHGLITDFGKFIDPLADKFMVFGLLIAILAADTVYSTDSLYFPIQHIFIWVVAAVMLRELGVTSLRMVVASRGAVIPASWWGKVKTCTQIAALVVILMEPAVLYSIFGDLEVAREAGGAAWLFVKHHLFSWVAMVSILVTTIGSGIDYLCKLWPYLSGKK